MTAKSGNSGNPPKPTAIILAAGKGTRMKGDLPKVVHPVGGRAMVCAVVDACRDAGCGRIIVVVGYKQELVREALAGYPEVEFAVQDQQLGTGHAVLSAEQAYRGRDRKGAANTATADPTSDESILVLCGDGPLIRPETIETILNRHRASHAAATLATAIIDDPTGYGRIVRDEQAGGRFKAIVEHKNATEEQRKIREVNPSYYCFNAPDLFAALKQVKRNPQSGEYYLTDTLELLLAQGKRVEVVPAVPPEDVLSINTPEDLALVDNLYRARSDSGLRTQHSGLIS